MSKWGKSATACRGVEPSELLEPRCSLPKKRLKVGILKAQFQNFTPRHGTCRTFSCQISRLLRHVAAGRGSSCRLPSPCFPRRQAHRPSCGAGPVPERFVPCLRAPGSAKRHPPRGGPSRHGQQAGRAFASWAALRLPAFWQGNPAAGLGKRLPDAGEASAGYGGRGPAAHVLG